MLLSPKVIKIKYGVVILSILQSCFQSEKEKCPYEKVYKSDISSEKKYVIRDLSLSNREFNTYQMIYLQKHSKLKLKSPHIGVIYGKSMITPLTGSNMTVSIVESIILNAVSAVGVLQGNTGLINFSSIDCPVKNQTTKTYRNQTQIIRQMVKSNQIFNQGMNHTFWKFQPFIPKSFCYNFHSRSRFCGNENCSFSLSALEAKYRRWLVIWN